MTLRSRLHHAHILPLSLLAFEEKISSFSRNVALPTVLDCLPRALSSSVFPEGLRTCFSGSCWSMDLAGWTDVYFKTSVLCALKWYVGCDLLQNRMYVFQVWALPVKAIVFLGVECQQDKDWQTLESFCLLKTSLSHSNEDWTYSVFREADNAIFMCNSALSIHQGNDRRNVYPAVSISVASMHSSCRCLQWSFPIRPFLFWWISIKKLVKILELEDTKEPNAELFW